MPVFTEIARAKVNLTLQVLGRQPDGYHDIASLVAFAELGDIVTLDTAAATTGVSVSGPFASALVGENLVTTTLQRLAAAHPALKLGAVHLEKRLPVAAGIGGGSADAAAVLRAVRQANDDLAATVPWAVIAASLGADVPVCLANTTSWITGVGDHVQDVPHLPSLDVVLVNALAAVPADKTARVFRALAASPVEPPNKVPSLILTARQAPAQLTRPALLEFMRARGNDLQAVTLHVVPTVGEVLAVLGELTLEAKSVLVPGMAPELAAAQLVGMSGAGPTCFAIYPDAAVAQRAAQLIRERRPGWWAVATRIGCQ